MTPKITFALLTAIVLIQGAYSAYEAEFSHEDGTARGPVKDKIKESLAKLTEKVQMAIAAAISKLQGLNLTSELNNFISEMTQVVNKAISTIKELTQNAADIGVDVSSCTKSSTDDIKQLGIDTVRDLTSCGTDKVGAASIIIDETIIEVKKTGGKIAEISKTFSSCGHSVSCYTKVAAKIAAAVVELPAHITKQVAQAVELVTSLKGDLTKCAVNKLTVAVPKIDEIVKTVSTCVSQKINSHGL